MTKTQEMQHLHHRSSLGEKLSESERLKLQNWYDELDGEESIINRDNRQIDLAAMRERLEQTTTEVLSSSRKVAPLLKQSEKIRRENPELRQQVEARLSEQKAA